MGDPQADVLVVEDDPNDLELTLRALRRHRLANEVRVARDGAEAIRFIFGADEDTPLTPAPKVILLDLKLPRLSGLDVLRRVKADARRRALLDGGRLDAGARPGRRAALNYHRRGAAASGGRALAVVRRDITGLCSSRPANSVREIRRSLDDQATTEAFLRKLDERFEPRPDGEPAP
jgi:CheY-like chemotaxis protein